MPYFYHAQSFADSIRDARECPYFCVNSFYARFAYILSKDSLVHPQSRGTDAIRRGAQTCAENAAEWRQSGHSEYRRAYWAGGGGDAPGAPLAFGWRH